MCERRIRKIKKGSQVSRLREMRRLQRQQRLVPAAPPLVVAEEPAAPGPCPPPATTIEKTAQCRLILELALKTISLMQKNSVIQQKIVALQKETSEFVATVMSNPENRQRYLEHIRLYGSVQRAHAHLQPSLLPNTERQV